MAKVIDLVDDLKSLIHNRNIMAAKVLELVKNRHSLGDIALQYANLSEQVERLKTDIIRQIEEEELD